MEILMKLKCSPAATSRSPHSTLKVVDHHHQLQQQHILGSGTHMQSPLTSSPASAPMHDAALPLPPPLPMSLPSGTAPEMIMPSCLEYAATTMDCCSAAQQDMVLDLPWERSGSGVLHRGHRGAMQLPGTRGDPLCSEFMHSLYAPTHTQQNNSSPSPLNLACCAAFEPPCCTGIPYRTTGGGGVLLPPTPLQQHHVRLQQHCLNPIPPLINANANEYSNNFVYQEPDENFVSIDDAKVKGFLMKIGEKEQQRRRKVKAENTTKNQPQPVVYEIIELDDEEQATAVTSKYPALASPLERSNPQQLERRTEKIVARIDLVDSSSESEPDAEAELPLAAAAAVSCELQCDADDEDGSGVQNEANKARSGVAVVVLNSEDEEENIDFIDEQEEGVELRWDELEESRERAFFECFLCGKKVQSSYNLRRHMMIHTGERPFGCDLCERRFREFSDLKKHRRRHILDPNFTCMICRLNTPSEHDPTRCLGCDSKSAAALAAMRPQVLSSPEKSQTPPSALCCINTKKAPLRHLTPASTPPMAATSPLVVQEPSNVKSPPLSPSPTLPPLTPIASMTRPPPSTSETQLILDSVPAVHRPAFNQPGVVTRKEFPCPLCQRPFGTRHNLKRHFMIHTGEKPFNCTKCRKPFREYSTLKKHMVTHKRERWYKCHICAYKSRDYLDYIDHKRTHPKSSTSSSPTKKRSKSKHAQFQDDSYDSNEDDSSAEDWLECCECGQRFTDIEIYTEHLKEHDPTIFLYECYVCKETFAERERLVKHLAGHDEQTKKQAAEEAAFSVEIDDKNLEE